MSYTDHEINTIILGLLESNLVTYTTFYELMSVIQTVEKKQAFKAEMDKLVDVNQKLITLLESKMTGASKNG